MSASDRFTNDLGGPKFFIGPKLPDNRVWLRIGNSPWRLAGAGVCVTRPGWSWRLTMDGAPRPHPDTRGR